jgi:alpha-soluble NSF attachment protein
MNAFHNAAKSYKKCDPEGMLHPSFLCLVELIVATAAVSALHKTIGLLLKSGNFRQAADREKEVS